MTTTNQNTARTSGTFEIRKSLADDGRYMAIRFQARAGESEVLIDDGCCTPFRVSVTEARRRWLADLAKGWTVSA